MVSGVTFIGAGSAAYRGRHYEGANINKDLSYKITFALCVCVCVKYVEHGVLVVAFTSEPTAFKIYWMKLILYHYNIVLGL